ncbi:hypothetical protein AMS68_001012 [Peltaster fructicola]|uniref:Uncharacterized protein n=1 Tax=Peltaster fructicola TaxID=286661 RepID=A0A6H0XLJ0_9PEZI|nr:hypothetical protein AMS68_001012 [Peltaster fructicola]
MSNHQLEDDAISNIEGSSLFSDGDSEIIDSPTDGYFSQRQHPQQLFVENDTSSKAQEAVSSPARPSHSQDLPTSSRPPTWATEQTPLLDAGPAPPDYYAATADRRANDGHVRDNLTYGSISEEHSEPRTAHTPRVLLQAGFFGTHRTPQSMIGTRQHIDEESQLTAGGKPKRKKCWRMRIGSRSKRCLGILLAVALITVVIVFGIRRSKNDNNVGKTPEDSIPSPIQPEDPNGSPDEALPVPSPLPGCTYSTRPKLWQYDFHGISNFTFEEALTPPSSQYRLGGNIWIRAAPEYQTADIKVTMSFVTTAGLKVLDPRAELSHDSIKVGFPVVEQAEPYTSYESCLELGIAIDVRSGLSLDQWTAMANNFNIIVLAPTFGPSDIDVERQPSIASTSIFDTSTFVTSSGTIDAAYWSSRRAIINTDSGSIHGRYALRDLLSITTKAGSVAIDVDPKKADKDKPVAAVFKAVSKSGSIRASFPIKDELPKREYDTTVESTSGSISGSYIHGTHSTFRCQSGAIVATIIPFNSSAGSQLRTSTGSGSTSLQILTPYDGGALKHMHSKHDSTQGSGSIVLRYPDEWEGILIAMATSGSIIVHGHNVKTDRVIDVLSSFKKVVGRKGVGGSLVEVSTRSGSIDLGIGVETESRSFLKRLMRMLELAFGWSQWEEP